MSRRVTKEEFKKVLRKLTEDTRDEFGRQHEMNDLIRELVSGLSEDEKLKATITHKIEMEEDERLVPALEKINRMIREKEDLIRILAMKTTPFVNEVKKK